MSWRDSPNKRFTSSNHCTTLLGLETHEIHCTHAASYPVCMLHESGVVHVTIVSLSLLWSVTGQVSAGQSVSAALCSRGRVVCGQLKLLHPCQQEPSGRPSVCTSPAFINLAEPLPPSLPPSLSLSLPPSLPPSHSPSLPPSLPHSLPPSLPPSLPLSRRSVQSVPRCHRAYADCSASKWILTTLHLRTDPHYSAMQLINVPNSCRLRVQQSCIYNVDPSLTLYT